jgi:hypothetical protein
MLAGQAIKTREPSRRAKSSQLDPIRRCAGLASHVRFAPNSFITVSALSPTLAIAASISAFDFLRRLHHCRASSLREISTRFRALFVDEDVSMTKNPTWPTSAELQFCSATVVVSFDATVFVILPHSANALVRKPARLARRLTYRQLRGDRFRQRRSSS